MPHRIKLSDIKAYFDFYPSSDPAWMIDLILATDKAFLDGIANKGKGKSNDTDKDPRLKKRR